MWESVFTPASGEGDISATESLIGNGKSTLQALIY